MFGATFTTNNESQIVDRTWTSALNGRRKALINTSTRSSTLRPIRLGTMFGGGNNYSNWIASKGPASWQHAGAAFHSGIGNRLPRCIASARNYLLFFSTLLNQASLESAGNCAATMGRDRAPVGGAPQMSSNRRWRFTRKRERDRPRPETLIRVGTGACRKRSRAPPHTYAFIYRGIGSYDEMRLGGRRPSVVSGGGDDDDDDDWIVGRSGCYKRGDRPRNIIEGWSSQ